MSDLEDSGEIERVYENDDDMEFMDEDDNMEDGEYGGDHMDYYRDDKQYDPDMSFERDPKRLTKVKAKLMFNLNKERKIHELQQIYQDILLSSVAMQYAISLKDNPNNQPYLKQLREQSKVDVQFKKCELISNYEQDVPINKAYTEKFFQETSYLFWEMDQEREILMDSLNTHVGIGLAGNSTCIVVVLLVVSRQLAILEIKDCGDGRVEVKGKMLDPGLGIVGARLFNNIDYIDQHPKQIYYCLQDKIQFSRISKQFVIFMELNVNWKEKKWMQLFFKDNPQNIQYRKPIKDKKSNTDPFKSYNSKKKILTLFQQYPDEQFINEYALLATAQHQKLEQEQKVGQILQAVHEKIEEREDEKPVSVNEEDSSKMQEEEEDEQDMEKKNQLNKEPATSNKQIKEELLMAIGQAKSTYDGLVESNRLLQEKIKEIREKNLIVLDKTNQASMNQHKYLNILAQVHQTRLQLKQTQDRYNRMSTELQYKLNQKQSKCHQIRNSFQQLKRQVAKKATYSRSDLPIKPQRIEEWEEKQHKITQELQNLRLEILRARNSLAKNQKILKKKQQLAQGLHLIDFEQLKIQNQTLNEKIQQRNEDLHKLKKKTTSMVQILTHTREKLIFVEKMKNDLATTAQKLDAKIQQLRLDINKTKQECQITRLNIQDAKHKTQIVNSQQLGVDYKKRTLHIQKLQHQIQQMLEKQKEMKKVIQDYQRKIRKQIVNK